MEERENVVSINWKQALIKAFQLGIFVSIAVLAPYFSNQLITGTIVNALLFISLSIMGLEYAFLLCLIPSLISLSTGLLPMLLAPMVPFIMMGNALMVLVFYKLSNPSTSLGARGFWQAAIPAALIKFIFIYSSGMILANFVLHNIAKNIMLMISWPQLATAIAGASVAYVLLKIIKKINWR